MPASADGTPLCILTVHAHPDDESSKGAGTIARYRDEGIRTVLVCCTGGELGDISNPAMDKPEVKENLSQVRRDELDRATKIIGYDDVIMLGYRDSGMADSVGNFDVRSFHRADMDEAVGRLVSIIRRFRPQVIVTYGDNQRGYPHPDHLKVHDITGPAFDRAGDSAWYPWAGEPWQPLKLYYSAWSRERFLGMHQKFLDLGMESPYDGRWFDRPSEDHRITSRVEVESFYDVRINALLAHATQIDPLSPWWFGLPHDEARSIHPYDDYMLARSRVGVVQGEDQRPSLGVDEPPVIIESDLFYGLR
jgi:mycothiol S-conjugate amidase